MIHIKNAKSSSAMITRLSRGDTVAIGNTEYEPVEQNSDGIWLRRLNDTKVVEFFDYKKLAQLRTSGDWRYKPKPKERTLPDGVSDLTLLPSRKRNRLLSLYRVLLLVKELREQGSLKLTDSSIEDHMPDLINRLYECETMQQNGARRSRSGDITTMHKPPCARSIRHHFKKWADAGFDPLILQRRKPGPRIISAEFNSEVEEIVEESIRLFYMTRQKASKRSAAEETQRGIRQMNDLRANDNLPPLAVPSVRTIERRIATLDPFEAACLRDGVDKARAKFSTAQLSSEVLAQFPGERIEIDEWEVDLRSYFMRMGVMSSIPPHLRARIPAGRRWVYAAIDCATRCILGLLIVAAPSSEAALKVLRMTLVDKSDLARAVGAKSDWRFCAGLNTVCCDTGPAFRSNEFTAGVNSLGGTILFPPVKIPELRGHVERFFGTLAQQLMPRLSGRTFSNPKARGDYPTEAATALNDDDISRILCLFVIDYYHNRPHRGLNGQTPANRWRDLELQFAVSEPPDMHAIRAAIGFELVRKPSKRGVLLFSNYYSCAALARLWTSGKRGEVRIRVDVADIGAVSIEIDGAWHVAPSMGAESLHGVSLEDWITAFSAIRQKYAREAELTEGIRDNAVREIRNIDAAARLRAGVTLIEPSRGQIKAVENTLFRGVSFQMRSTPSIQPHDVLVGELIQPSSSRPDNDDHEDYVFDDQLASNDQDSDRDDYLADWGFRDE